MSFTRPVIQAMLEFEGADFWSEQGAERFGAKTPLEAIERYMDETILRDAGDVGAFLQEHPTWWTFTAYKRQAVSDWHVKSWSEGIAEHLRESFAEEHGDYEDGDDGLSDDSIAELNRRSRELVDWYLTRARVFPCEHLRNFTLDSEDILELVQQLRPQWLIGFG